MPRSATVSTDTVRELLSEHWLVMTELSVAPAYVAQCSCKWTSGVKVERYAARQAWADHICDIAAAGA